MSGEKIDNRYMEFKLGDQLYAVPLLAVKEVIQKPEVTAVPNMPSHFEGMMNLRGQILGVYSIRKKLNAKPKEKHLTTTDVVMVIEHEGISVGMIVDEVTKVLHAETDKIKPAPLKEDDPAKSFVTSVIQAEGELVLAVNVSQLLELNKYLKQLKVAA
jgi:purine-binding chemotaxis protein CheW